jgi:hypothetical protein
MNAHTFITRQRTLLEAMQANAERECLIIANDLLALTRLRVNTEGLDSDNQPFAPYSPAYARQRQARGRQVAFVDFSDTGKLWGAVRATVEATGPGFVRVVITARDQLSQAKLAGALGSPQPRPRGNILVPTEDEIAMAAEANRRRIAKYIAQ